MLYNSAVAWDEATHPWLLLGKVVVTSLLPDDINNSVRYHYSNVPAKTLVLPQPIGLHDFKVVSFLKEEIHHFANYFREEQMSRAMSSNVTEYFISWHATPMLDSEVYISLIGG